MKRLHTHREDTEAFKKVSPIHKEANGEQKKQKTNFIYLYTYIKYYQANASTVQGSSLQAKPKLNQ